MAKAMTATRTAPFHACLLTARLYDSWVTRIPPWARDLHRASSLSRDSQTFRALLDRVLEPVQRFCCSPSTGLGGNKQVDLQPNLNVQGYSVSRSQAQDLFRKTDPALLDVAVPGDVLLDPRQFLEYPYTNLFSDEGLQQCLVAPQEREVITGHTSLNLAPGVDKLDLLAKIGHMCYFSTDKELREGDRNGTFALFKKLCPRTGLEKHRLVFDGVKGNAHASMDKAQRLYERLCADAPAQAARLRCGEKIMNIASPSDVADFPPGAACKSSSDYKSYFFQWLQLPFLLRFQGLFDVAGHLVGSDADVVRVGLKVLAMGNLFSALIAHVAHWVLLTRALVKEPLRAVRPELASDAHREDVAIVVELASREKDGCVPWSAIPERMRAALRSLVPKATSDKTGGPDLLTELRVPPSMLLFEPLPKARLGKVHADSWVEVVTSLVGGGKTARADVASTLARNANERAGRYWSALAVVYQDDNDTFMYPPEPASSVEAQQSASSVGGFHRLVTILAADAAGLRQNFDKLAFPSRATSPTLGVEITFLPGPRGCSRASVSALRRRKTVAELEAIIKLATRQNKVVLMCEKQLASVVGDVTWAFLVRRPLLSLLDVCYKAPHSPNRPPGFVWLTSTLVRELWLCAGLLPLAESTSSLFTDCLTTFDASGKSRLGNGGYGVAYKTGMSQEVATELTTTVGRAFGRLPVFKVQPGGEAPRDRLERPRHARTARRAARFLQFNWSPGSKTGWKAARAGRFKSPPRIVTVAETFAGSMGFAASLRHADADHRILCIGGDNMAADSALVKGRSSVCDINKVCRRVAARSLFYDVEARWWWMPSKANPADGPSRWWIVPRARRPVPQASVWIRDLHRENIHPHPGPVPPIVQLHEHLVRRAARVGGKHVFAARADKFPYKGVLPPRDCVFGPLSLLSDKVSHSYFRTMVKAFTGFDQYFQDTWFQHEDYAEALVSFVQHCYDSGDAARASTTHVLCFLAYVDPEAKAHCTFAWKAWAGWGKRAPRKSWLPLPRVLALLFAFCLMESNNEYDFDVGLALLLAFHVYARGAEIDGLRCSHVVFGSDLRSLTGRTQVFFVTTKAGRPQAVTVDNAMGRAVVQLAFRRARRRQSTSTSDPTLFEFGPGGFMQRFKRIQRQCGYLMAIFVRHSCRHGGATNDFSRHLRAMVQVSQRLRHADTKTTQAYLQDTQAHLLMQAVPRDTSVLVQQLGGEMNLSKLVMQRLMASATTW